MKRILLLAIFVFCVLEHQLSAQQVADTLFNPPIPDPVYAEGKGPLILIDEAHSNFHTAEGRFKPFASVLRRDGYRVGRSTKSVTPETLSEAKVLVIANALHDSNTGKWTLPTPSAFTDEEITTLNQWVKNGGSLFLIADHMPFPGATEKLASSFGFTFYNGFAMRRKAGRADIFETGRGLKESVITSGRNTSEKVSSLQTFTGQAFDIPTEATPIVILNGDYEILLPETAWEFDKNTKSIGAAGKIQGAFMKYGQGRLAVFGEAAMFSAQVQGGKNKFGMNAPSASQNVQFLLNVIHWLDNLIE